MTKSVEPKTSSNGNQMLQVVYVLTHDASGKKLKESYDQLWYYPIMDHDHPFVQARWKEFIAAYGLKKKGTLDTDKIVGKIVQLKLKTDTDQDGEYRPRVGKVMGFSSNGDEPDQPVEPDDEPEPEEDDEPEAGADDDIDLEELDRSELKKLIKEHGFDIKVTKSMTEAAIREAIALAADDEEEDEEEEDEEEDEEAEAAGEDYTAWPIADLKSELKERELPTNGSKKILAARLKADDGEGPF